uniref:Uncharacterized protein n=1 Tax=Ascaris lumbricoides TaxID=6252 RepID=A0A0M3HK28_ASCLU
MFGHLSTMRHQWMILILSLFRRYNIFAKNMMNVWHVKENWNQKRAMNLM